MAVHPEVQAKAQAEIDSVTGGNRLPKPEDAEKSPYISAMIKEILRWAPVAPLGEIVLYHTVHLSAYNSLRVFRSHPCSD